MKNTDNILKREINNNNIIPSNDLNFKSINNSINQVCNEIDRIERKFMNYQKNTNQNFQILQNKPPAVDFLEKWLSDSKEIQGILDIINHFNDKIIKINSNQESMNERVDFLMNNCKQKEEDFKSIQKHLLLIKNSKENPNDNLNLKKYSNLEEKINNIFKELTNKITIESEENKKAIEKTESKINKFQLKSKNEHFDDYSLSFLIIKIMKPYIDSINERIQELDSIVLKNEDNENFYLQSMSKLKNNTFFFEENSLQLEIQNLLKNQLKEKDIKSPVQEDMKCLIFETVSKEVQNHLNCFRKETLKLEEKIEKFDSNIMDVIEYVNKQIKEISIFSNNSGGFINNEEGVKKFNDKLDFTIEDFSEINSISKYDYEGNFYQKVPNFKYLSKNSNIKKGGLLEKTFENFLQSKELQFDCKQFSLLGITFIQQSDEKINFKYCNCCKENSFANEISILLIQTMKDFVNFKSIILAAFPFLKGSIKLTFKNNVLLTDIIESVQVSKKDYEKKFNVKKKKKYDYY